MALSSTFLAVLLVLLCIQRVVVGRKEFTTVTGRSFNLRRTALGRWKNFVLVLVVLLALIVTVVPTIFLVLGTFMKLFGFFDVSDPWTLNNWRQVLQDPVILRSLWNTLVVALGSAMVGVFLYSLIAYVIVKTSFTFRGSLISSPGFLGPSRGFFWESRSSGLFLAQEYLSRCMGPSTS
jgi:iron(III) transport system permease protein